MKDPLQIINFPSALGGLDENSSFTDPPKGTTPLVLNCRPFDGGQGRRRLSRRPALEKYLSTQIANASIQDISTVVATVDSTAGSGDVWGQGTGGDFARVYRFSDGTGQTQTAALTSTATMGTVDEDGNFYVCSISAGSIRLVKSTGTTTNWTKNVASLGSASALIFGLAAFNNVVYLFLADGSSSAVFRFSGTDGAQLDSGAWLTTSNSLGTIAVSGGTAITLCYQGIVIAGGILGVVCGVSGNLVLQQFNLTTGALIHQTTLETFNTYPVKLVTDQGGNFYVLTNIANSPAEGITKPNVIYKVGWDGTIKWKSAATSAAGYLHPPGAIVPLVTSNARDMCYEPTLYRIIVVGTSLFGLAGNSLQVYDATAGGYIASASPSVTVNFPAGTGTNTPQFTWTAITADGLGGIRLRFDNGGGANKDTVYVNANGLTPWSTASGWNPSGETLWLVCASKATAATPSTMVPTRIVRAVVVCGGGLYRVEGDAITTISTTFCSGAAPVVFSTINAGKVIFVDGSSYPIYDASANTAGVLTASVGEVPSDPGGGKCRLCCTYRGRLVLAAMLSQPYNYFMSAVNDITNFNYAPVPTVETQAVAGNNGPAGSNPDIINALIPWSDDVLLFGGDHTIHRLSGDPQAGGKVDFVSDVTGIAFGKAWCMDPAGTIYFYGSRGAVWRMQVGGQPQRLSNAIDSARLFNVDLSEHIVRMVWDDRWRGFHLFISPIDPTQETIHYWWDSYTDVSSTFQVVRQPGSWWPDEFGSTNFNPLAVHVFDGDDPGDRVVLMGGRDGYLRTWSNTGTKDDGKLIDSYVMVGPIQTKEGSAFRLCDLQCTLSGDSANVSYSVHAAESTEAAVSAPALETGTFSAGRNPSQAVRSRAHALYVKMHSNAAAGIWSMEALRGVIEVLGRIAQRQF